MPIITRLAGGLAAPHAPTLHVATPPGCPPDVRLVTSPDSALVVGAAPVAQIDHLLRQPAFRQRPLAYLPLAPANTDGQAAEIYIGETIDGILRIARHRRSPPLAADAVVLVACHVDSFGRDAIQALQHGLTAQARRAGRCRIIGAPPLRAWLQIADPGQLAQWLADLRPTLVAVGCTALEQPGARLRPRLAIPPLPVTGAVPELVAVHDRVADVVAQETEVVPAPLQAVLQGYRLDLPVGLYVRPDAEHFSLAWEGVRAEVVRAGPWTVLRAGSRAMRDDDSSIQPCLSRKREALVEAGVLRPSGRPGVLQVVRDVALPSLTNAGRVVTGTNLPHTIWIAA